MTYIGSLTGGSSSSSSSSSSALPGVSGGISGLASGVDTDSIVQGLMESAQEPLIQLLQQRQITQWKQDIYQRTGNTLTDLQNDLSSLQLQSTFLQTTATSSNSSVVSATSNGASANGSYSVTVQQLASGATATSSQSLSTNSNYANTPIGQILGDSSSDTSLSFTLNGQTFKVNPQTDTINSILQDINSNPAAGVTGFYDSNAGKVVLQTDGTGSGAKMQVSSDDAGIFTNLFGLQPAQAVSYSFTGDSLTSSGTVDINGTHFQFTNGESLEDVTSQINAQAASTGVVASYDSSTNKLTLNPATTSQTLNFSSAPAAGSSLDIDGTEVQFYDSSKESAPSDQNGIAIDVNGKSASDVASAVASAISANGTLSGTLSAAASGSSLTLTALAAGTGSDFTTSVPSAVTLGSQTLGTDSTPTTQSVTFSGVPSAGDELSVDGQTFEFYDSSTGNAPTGTGVTAIDTHGLDANGVASAVASKLPNGVKGSASDGTLTLTASSNGATSLGVSYTPNAAITGVGATDESDATGLYSGISVSDPLNYGGQTVLGQAYDASGDPVTDSADVAKNAYYTVNGYSTSSQSNQANYNGTTLSLNAVTSSPVNISVAPDVDSIVQTITNFVQQYNETLQYIQGQYSTQPNNSYLPLTAAQAAQMTDTQVTEWNQKAQSGLLGNDTLLGGIMSSLETATTSMVSGQPTSEINGQTTQMNSLYSIGISPIDPYNGLSSGATAPGVTTTGYSTYGLLQIDPDQLKAAIEANPTAVMNLFTASGSSSGSSGSSTNASSSDTGIAKQLYEVVSSSITQIQQQAGTGDTYDPTGPDASSSSSSSSTDDSSLLAYTLIDPNADLSTLFSTDDMDTSFIGEEISVMDSQATDMDSQLQSLQTRYQNEFSNMESAIEQVNSQSSYIVSMMGGSSSS